jgi:predicted GH43/DUF377 family glycosyl hydrolase
MVTTFVREPWGEAILPTQQDTVWESPDSGPVSWEAKDVFNPSATRLNGRIALVYRAEDHVGRFAGTSRVGLALSDDGVSFERLPAPILYPDPNDFMWQHEAEGGCEDPRVHLREDGLYILTYTSYNGQIAKLAIATSWDLVNWTKQGLAFTGLWAEQWTKSGSIFSREVGDCLVMDRIHGRYWMLFGESDIYLATSDDGIVWTPVTRSEMVGRKLDHSVQPPTVSESWTEERQVSVIRPRDRRFDSKLVEPGPPPVRTDQGYWVIYNSCNNCEETGFLIGSYSPGMALLDGHDPTAVLHRATEPFLVASHEFERTGQVPNVVFAQGLVPHGDKWLLYHGMGDAAIGVAVAPRQR